MVFDGRAHLVDLRPQQGWSPDEREMGPPTVTLRTSVHLTPANRYQAPPATAARPASANVTATREIARVWEAEPVMPAWAASSLSPRRGARVALAVLAVLLLLALLAQATYYFRHVLAADYPQFRPYLAVACEALGCTLDALRNKDEISIESHDLQADPAHQGLLILQTTLRNQARHRLAFPHLELELTDLGGQSTVRRVFAPVEYAGGAADFANGMPANAEWNVKIFLDASGVRAGGYSLYLFYP
jgi:hypothetical protein